MAIERSILRIQASVNRIEAAVHSLKSVVKSTRQCVPQIDERRDNVGFVCGEAIVDVGVARPSPRFGIGDDSSFHRFEVLL